MSVFTRTASKNDTTEYRYERALYRFSATVLVLKKNAVAYQPCKWTLRSCLQRISVSMLQQLCDNTSNTVLIENNGAAPDWRYNPFWSDSIVFNESSIASVVVALTLTLGVIGP